MDMIQSGIVFFQKGGSIMYVLLLCSFFVVAVAVERFRYFSRADAGRSFALSFYEEMGSGRTREAAALAIRHDGVIPGILLAAAKSPEGKFGNFLEVQTGIALAKLRARLYYLSVIVTMAPLLGLLGTISGMISAFSVFNLESGQATAITGGVGEALIATAMGLCVAIVALSVHAYFKQRVENIITDMEQCFSLVEGNEAEWRQAVQEENHADS